MMAPPAAVSRAAAAADMSRPQAFNLRTAQYQAMLMSPMPVLANMMKEQVRQGHRRSVIPGAPPPFAACLAFVDIVFCAHCRQCFSVVQLQLSAAQAAEGANSLLDLSVDDDGVMGVLPMNAEDAPIGTTAMVGAAAAAVALLNLRAPAH